MEQVPNEIYGGIVTAQLFHVNQVKHAKEGEFKLTYFYKYHNVSHVSKNGTNEVPKLTPGYDIESFSPNSS